MTKVGLPPVLASACVVLAGRYGDVTQLAQRRGVCRQALYRETTLVLTAVRGDAARRQREHLEQTIAQLRQRVRHLQEQLARAVVVDRDGQERYAATAQAEGVSLPVAQRLLRVFLGAATPSVAQLGRFSRQAARRATAVLAVLDPPSRALVRQASADELFVGRRPVLMLVEPDSLCWVGAHLAERRDGPQWAEEFAQLPHLEHVLRDAGTGLEKGLEQLGERRRQGGTPAVAQTLDHFHVLREGTRALRRLQGQSSRALEQAERADKALARRARSGGKLTGPTNAARPLWQRAEAALDRWIDQERAWQRLRAGVALFTADGRLNSRGQAEAVVGAVRPQLQGPEWDKVRRHLQRPEMFGYLDRVHQKLSALPVPDEARQAALRAVELERRVPRGPQAVGGAAAGLLLMAELLRGMAERLAAGVVQAVRDILACAWRGSSAVEGMNSVLRMQQGRHRRLTQGLLDLKRLYWNCRPLRTGRRRRQTPYERLGLKLPVNDWWQLLNMPPEQLKEQLSAPKKAA
jgi:hypothetical protein